ncbi:phage portal protein [Microcella alkaliphila]|uniref:HK97 family phage portal protein n=1 Tax=Microcella alkaliphila TaxID=279828 RepID=A0A0U5B9F9_9MICO|nr:phage portal protein [Microcella alkaliphila]BAU32464.1 uncharacterized protein MalAC0309_1613 [Microcella alkaliphila]
MAFAVSAGSLQAIQKPTARAPYSLRLSDDLSEDYAAIYRSQDAVRTVVDFLARNIAQLGLHSYRRLSDTDRERLTDHPLPQLLSRPNSRTTTFRLMRSLVADRGIYDAAYWLKIRENGAPALVRLPPKMVTALGDNWLHPAAFEVKGNRGKTVIPADRIIHFHGYSPTSETDGVSPIETLRRILAEAYAAGQMREQVLRNGARHSGYITRPQNSEWSDAAARRFKEGWRAQYQGQSATEAGGTPVLEDGMQFVPASQTAADLQYVEARKLTREEVAAAYHIPPPMVGLLDKATFSNIEEQHKMLYQDTLGPMLEEIQQELELQLLPEFDDVDGVYIEFNLAEKLRGSFEEQAAQLQTSVGAPYMTRNEARARANLPAVAGGDELVTPLNVLIGGQASPTDSAPDGQLSWRIPGSKALGPVRVKARPQQSHVAQMQRKLSDFFARQEQEVRSQLGAKSSAPWWDEERWENELAADLYALSAMMTVAVARRTAASIGLDPDDYDVDRTLAYQATVARSNARSINAVTRIQLETALDEAEEPLEQAAQVFEVAKTARAQQAGTTIATALAGWATVEAVEQLRGTRGAVKTWVTTSSNPRSSHAAMNGETVPLDSTFSNGARWPGDSAALDVEDIAGCECDVVITLE